MYNRIIMGNKVFNLYSMITKLVDKILLNYN